MTGHLDKLRLEVETSNVRNRIRDPHGALGGAGWMFNRNSATPSIIGGSAISGSTSPAAQDGYAYKLQPFTDGTMSRTGQMISSVFDVVAGQYLTLRNSVDTLGTPRPLTAYADFFDSLGQPVSTLQFYAGNLATSDTERSGAVQVPAGATGASVRIVRPTAVSGSVLVSRIMVTVRSDTNAPAWSVPTWLNILGPAASITTEQGNTLEGVEDTLEPGILTAVILSETLDPAVANTLSRNRALRLRYQDGSTDLPVWQGSIENAEVDYEDDRPRITLTATDSARDSIAAAMPVLRGTTFDEHIAGVMAAASQYGARRSVLGLDVIARDDSAKAADWARRTCNTFGGFAWVDATDYLQSCLSSDLGQAPTFVATDSAATDAAGLPKLRLASAPITFGTKGFCTALDVTRVNVDEADDSGSKTYGPYIVSASEALYGRVGQAIEIVGGSPSAVATSVLSVFGTPRRFPTELRFTTIDNPALVLANVKPYAAARVVRFGLFDDVVRVLRVRHEITARAWRTTATARPREASTSVTVTTPAAGADTGPGDIAPANLGVLGSRYRSSNYSINNVTWTTVPLDTLVAGDGITWDSANNRYVVQKEGRYLLTAGVRYSGATAGSRGVAIAVNGVQIVVQIATPSSGASTTVSVVATKAVRLAVGDTIALQAYQSSGAALTVYGNAERSTHLDAVHLGA